MTAELIATWVAVVLAAAFIARLLARKFRSKGCGCAASRGGGLPARKRDIARS